MTNDQNPMTKFFDRPDGVAQAFLLAGAAWFVVGTLYGLLAAITLVAPELFDNIPFLVFGRSRPVHVNTVVFGFVTTTLIGAGLYYVPALLRTRLWSERLGWASFALWNIGIASGPITFGAGHSQGREYAEYLWFFDVCIELALLLGAVNVLMTLKRRRTETLHVAVWYLVGAFLWTACAYPIGNVMWRPATGALPGLVDSIVLWFYGHNLPGLLLTPLAVGAAYFVIPRVTGTPIYSHTLSLVGFWTLVALYTHIGGHHILQAPIPNWLKAMSVTHSVAMALPVYTVLVNLWMTARGRSGALLADPGGRFMLFSSVWYVLVCTQGPLQSLPAMQRVTHFNNWTIGHAHIAVLGFAGFAALGALWHVLPLAARRHLYSTRLAHLQFGLLMFGLSGFFIVLTIAGLIQGTQWHHGAAEYRVLPQIAIYMALRAALGVAVVGAAFIGLYNAGMTVARGRPLAAAAGEGTP